MPTKIKLNIPELSPEVSRSIVVIYDKDRNSLHDWTFRGNTTLIADYPIDVIKWFNIWTLVNNVWSIVLGGVPEMLTNEAGEEFLEINSRPKTISRPVDRAEKITEADSAMVNDILREESVSNNIPPTLPQMVRSLSSSVAGWAKQGFAMASNETLDARIAICKGCDFWDQAGFGGTGRCSKCGCSTQAKLRMATSSCPLDPPKWGPE